MKTFEEWKAENLDLSDMDAGRIGNSIILTGLEKCWHDGHDAGFAEGLTARKGADPKREELLKLAGELAKASPMELESLDYVPGQERLDGWARNRVVFAAAIIAEVDRVSGGKS